MTKTRVAVIGGGVGAITAAYAIARDPELRARHEITVYQIGWRLGGKGASGRQRDAHERILEHGLHVWGGFYDNAFRLLRDCYERMNALGLRDRAAPLGTMEAAFEPLDHLFLAEHVDMGEGRLEWRPWLIDLPTDGQRPGDATSAPTPFEMFLKLLRILVAFLEDGEFAVGLHAGLGPERARRLRGAHRDLHDHAHAMPREPHRHGARQSSLLVDLIEAAQGVVHEMQTPEALRDDKVRRALHLADLSLAYARGMAASDAFVAGYDALDQWEFTEFMRRHGAGESALGSVLLRGCYDFVFGFPHGPGLAADVGAGTAIRAMSRLLLGYRGAIFQKMRAGMGDTIFAPYYLVLKALGVKFRFFNAARGLRLDPTGTRVVAIDMVRQASPKGGDYDPLHTVEDLPCWPSEPFWDRIELVDALKGAKAEDLELEGVARPPRGHPYTLKAGEDFDEVILGASMGSLPYLTEDLAAVSQRWRRMLASVKTVGTRAAQFWLTKDQDALGWRELVDRCNPDVRKPEGSLETIMTGFGEPLDTWADMSHLLPREAWGPDGPKSIAYFCSPARDGLTEEEFRRDVRAWLNEDLAVIWQDERGRGRGHVGFDESELYLDADRDGDAFAQQYFRVNESGSERYVLSVTNSVYHRLAPGESGFERLTLAGDWTRCGLNAGCVEAATMSGLAAAEAVTGKPMLVVGADDVAVDRSLAAQAMYRTADVTSARWPLSGFYARGEMTGWFLFYQMPRAEVQALLPEGMHLAHTPLAARGAHPVGLSLCRYHDVRGSFVPDFLAMSPYGEASFAIPFVRTEATGRARFLYPRRLYVNSEPAIAAGRLFYAMDKARAEIQVEERRFVAATPAGKRFVEAEFVQHEDPAPLARHPAFGTIASLLDLPFVTDGRFGRLFNAFDMQLDHAWGAPAAGRVKVTDDQPGGFPHAELEVAPLRPDHPHGLPGAVRIWCSWSLTNPLDSDRIRRAAEAQSWLRRTY